MGRNLTDLYVSESFNHILQISGSDVQNGLGQSISGSTLDLRVISASHSVDSITTASAVDSTITFTKGDGSTFDVTVSQSGSIASASYATYAETAGTANTAATASLLLGNAEQVNHVDFAINSATTIERRLTWNDTDGTLNVGLKGGNVTLQVGQEEVARVVNGTGGDLLESQYRVVKVVGAQGQRLQVDLAQADSDVNSASTLGIVTEDILNNQEGFITLSGLVRNINTTGALQGETWNDGDVLYLSGTTPGVITNVKPLTPTHLVVVGYVVYAHATQGKIFVKVDNGYELEELHDVLITTPTDGQALVYSGSIWKNGTPVSSSHAVQANSALSASHAINSDNLGGKDAGSYATTGSNTFNGVQTIDSGAPTNNAIFALQGDIVALQGDIRAAAGAVSASLGFKGNLDGNAATATSASHALVSDTVSDPNVAYQNQDNNFTGTQTFDNIAVNGTGSFAYIQSVTGSAKIIGDAFIILNNNLPAERYAGIVVQDSGSGSPLTTASLEFDGQSNDWFYEYSNDGGVTTDHGVAMFGPEYATKGSPIYLGNNVIPKGDGGHHLNDSSISDDGVTVKINSNTQITGSVNATGNQIGLASTDAMNLSGTNTVNITSNRITLNSAFSNEVTGSMNIDGRITPSSGNSLDLMQYGVGGASPGSIRFYSGSTKGTNFVNMQVVPTSPGDVTISAFPANNHFLTLDVTNFNTMFGGRITGYYGADLQITGNTQTTGSITQNFTAPNLFQEVAFANVNGASVSGQAYNRVFYGIADYSAFGFGFEDYFAIEYYDGFGYNFGSEFNVNGRRTALVTSPSGSGASQAAEISTIDNFNGTSTAQVLGNIINVGTNNSNSINIGRSAATVKIQGSTQITGSVRGDVNSLSIAATTASLDASTGNYFDLSLVDGSNTHITVSNINPGQTYILKTTNGAGGTGTITFNSEFKFSGGTAPTATAAASAVDVYTFVSMDSSNVLSTQVTDLK